MHNNAVANASFLTASRQIEENLDSVVDHGNDDELFIASYLQGHFAVISKPLEVDPEASVAKLDAEVTQSLKSAFSNRELEAEDQDKVWSMWSQQIQQVSA
ncbi:YfcL family protein [Alteromonas lipotrueiana]|uniref:YfcL family protein n=1 Tax=Alteromonas lipotrueiana TaxID=2803815 RepID=UPI001C446216|nr:YfcL family protein [Alteromonas lipotrueiana]